MHPGEGQELDGLDARALTDRLLRNLDDVFEGRLGGAESEDATLVSLPRAASRALVSQLA
jgi:hypothetical protein